MKKLKNKLTLDFIISMNEIGEKTERSIKSRVQKKRRKYVDF